MPTELEVTPTNNHDTSKRLQLTEREAAEEWGLSVHWFRRKRWAGGGPAYRKIGNRCYYTRVELQRYFDDCTRKSTSEYQTRKPVEAIAGKHRI